MKENIFAGAILIAIAFFCYKTFNEAQKAKAETPEHIVDTIFVTYYDTVKAFYYDTLTIRKYVTDTLKVSIDTIPQTIEIAGDTKESQKTFFSVLGVITLSFGCSGVIGFLFNCIAWFYYFISNNLSKQMDSSENALQIFWISVLFFLVTYISIQLHFLIING